MNSNLIKYEESNALNIKNEDNVNAKIEQPGINDISLYSNISKPDLPNLQ